MPDLLEVSKQLVEDIGKAWDQYAEMLPQEMIAGAIGGAFAGALVEKAKEL